MLKFGRREKLAERKELKKYLEMPIKKVIEEFPEVGDILEKYGIGCVPCSVGACRFKDVMEIHNLSEKDEKVLLTKIAGVLFPGRHISLPDIQRKRKSASGKPTVSPPIKKLMAEHTRIKKLLSLIPRINESLNIETDEEKTIILGCIEFIRQYADRYHHAKEEEILFSYFDPNLDILKVMREDHENARTQVKIIAEALDNGDKNAIVRHLEEYHDLLTEHIRREDEILYPWIDKNLSITQVGELFSSFDKAEQKTDKDKIENLLNFVDMLEKRYGNGKVAERSS